MPYCSPLCRRKKQRLRCPPSLGLTLRKNIARFARYVPNGLSPLWRHVPDGTWLLPLGGKHILSPEPPDTFRKIAGFPKCKFRFGHAHGDPSKMMYINPSAGKSVPSSPRHRLYRITFIIFVILASLILGLVIVTSFMKK